jgi:hypothetical protein
MPSAVSLIDTVAQMPFALLNPVRDEHGPYGVGDYNIDNFLTSSGGMLPSGTYDIGGTWGLHVAVEGTIPASAGWRTGWNDPTGVAGSGDEWERRICQVVLLHYLIIPSIWIQTQVVNVNRIKQLIEWPVLVGSGARVGLHVDPGWQVDLYFMCLL